MPEPIVTFNEESLKTDLRELVRSTVEEMLNGLLDEEADDLVGAERYERTAGREAYRAGHYERKLTTTSGEGHDPHAQAQGHAVHHGDHRALPAPRDERRGGHDRDVPRGRLHQAHRGRLRDPLGLERLGVDRLQPQREGVRVGRGVAQQAARPGVPLRLRRRDIPQEILGRELRERGRDGGHRRERRRLPRGHRCRRGVHGVGGVLAGVSSRG